MEFAPAPIASSLAARYRAEGLTSDVSFPVLMRRNADMLGARVAVIEGEAERTWAELIDAAARFGGFLHAKGVGPGDVVVWQLPNWWETLVVAYGIWAAGAISSPVVPIYREYELGQVVAAVKPAAVVASVDTGAPGAVDRVAIMAAACEQAGVDPVVRVAVRGSAPGWVSFDDTVHASPYLAPALDVDAPALVGWTSGTTSGAKGVVHSTSGLLSLPARSTWQNGVTWTDRSYMPAPVAHATGLLSAIAVPLYSGSSTVLSPGWDAERAVADILMHGVTTTSGAAVFMRETLSALEALGQDRMPLAAGYPCGGSTIPVELAERCDDAGMQPARAWGMTECPGVTSSAPRLHGRDLRTATDGLVGRGCELRLVGDDGCEVSPGTDGEAWVRGPQRLLGYVDAHRRRVRRGRLVPHRRRRAGPRGRCVHDDRAGQGDHQSRR